MRVRGLPAASLAAFALIVVACGDDPPPPPAAPDDASDAVSQDGATRPAPAPSDHARVLEQVYDAARAGTSATLAELELPPSVSRVRVAVRAIHDHLLGVRPEPPTWDDLLTALDGLARAQGGPDAAALGPLVTAWRAWTPEQRAAERELAIRSARAHEVLSGRGAPDSAALAEALRDAPRPPPMSPAGASVAMHRAAALALAAPDGLAAAAFEDAVAVGDAALRARGWGGFGALADLTARRLFRAAAQSPRAERLADLAITAYAASGDEVNVAAVYGDLAERLRGEDPVRAEGLAGAASERLRRAGIHGIATADALHRHGELLQPLGRHEKAVNSFRLALDEIASARLDPARAAPIGERLATSLFFLGRFDEALAAAAHAAAAYDQHVKSGRPRQEELRAAIDEVSAQALVELGRHADAAAAYRRASARYASLARDDVPSAGRWALRRDQLTLFAAQSLVAAKRTDEAASAVQEVLAGTGVQPEARAHAASVLREMGRIDDAERELRAAGEQGGESFADALIEERARLAGARGDLATARRLFGEALVAATNGSDEPVGWPAARVLRDWSLLEERAGRLTEASGLAGKAVVQLTNGPALELDRARKRFADLQRRRLWFRDAEKITELRLESGPAGGERGRLEALCDLFLVRLELTLQEENGAHERARESVASLPQAPIRGVAHAALEATFGGAQDRPVPVLPELPPDAPASWRLLRRVVELARRTSDANGILDEEWMRNDEPELRRWAASLERDRLGGVAVTEARRSAAPASREEIVAAAGSDLLVLVEPWGHLALVTRIHAGAEEHQFAETGDGLRALWDAANVDPAPERLAAGAASVARALAWALEPLAGAAPPRRVIFSVSPPLGPLPFDLLPWGDGVLLDACEVLTVQSGTELVRARQRAAAMVVSELGDPHATLEARHGIVRLAPIDPASRARLFATFGAGLNRGLDASAALAEAKRAFRASPGDAAAGPPRIPAWAALVLRGAP